MKTRLLIVFALIGLISTEVSAASVNGVLVKRNRVVEELVRRDETINAKIKSLARNIDTKNVEKTIQILEDFNNKNLAYLKVSSEDITIFNETIAKIYKQKENIQDENSLSLLNEIKASSTKLNLIWDLRSNVISDEELNLEDTSSTVYKVVLPGIEM
ncbi:MAG: hypothetical protein RIR51_1115 [Bacteroidota bacterium]|jgi:aspartyl-tRNA synthetase